MKQLELSLSERLSFAQLLSSQKGEGRGATRVRPFFRVIKKIRLDTEEKTALTYREYQVPSSDGRMLSQAMWDANLALTFPVKKFQIENADAEACAALLKSDSLEITTGDIEWIDAILPQLEGKDVAMVPAEAAA